MGGGVATISAAVTKDHSGATDAGGGVLGVGLGRVTVGGRMGVPVGIVVCIGWFIFRRLCNGLRGAFGERGNGCGCILATKQNAPPDISTQAKADEANQTALF